VVSLRTRLAKDHRFGIRVSDARPPQIEAAQQVERKEPPEGVQGARTYLDSGGALSVRELVELSNDQHDLPLHFERAWIFNDDRIHRGIGRLQADPAAFAVDVLEGRLLAIA
jgi:hypothetical protein